MKQIILCAVLALCPIAATSQTQEDTDKSYLTQLIEDNLSGGSREVNIIGFQGALSSAATLDVLTVADVDGVWLTLEGVALTWNRSALLRGRIDVQELSAERIIVARAPISETSAPSPEATAFSLPELPVGIQLDQLDIAEITLGETFLGEEISLSLTGNAALSGGEGSAVIIATRLGDKVGRFAINGSYGNESRILALDLNISEGPDGIAARMIDLPGRPSTDLTISGTAPIDDYAATLSLATDGTDRISGEFALLADDTGRLISLDIGGDVTPLLIPEYRGFFGDDVALTVKARTGSNGEIDLQDLTLNAQKLQLSGTAKIGAQGWPERLDLKGQIADQSGDIVLLPLPGPKTYVDSGSFDLSFDANTSPDWVTDLSLLGFDRPGLFIRDLKLAGGGVLVPGEGAEIGEVTANLTYTASGLELDDAGASEAFGDTISGVFQAARTEGAPTKIEKLTLTGPGIEALAEATVGGTASGLRTQSNILLTVDALGRFSTLAGRDLAGSGDLAIASTIVPLEGLFDIILSGTTLDLAIGIDQVDAVLAGSGEISASAVRDTEGTRLETLRIKTPAALLTARANLTSTGSEAVFNAELAEVSLIEPRLSGPATMVGTATQNAGGVLNIDVSGDAKNTAFTVTADINPTTAGRTVNFATNAAVTDLATYAAIAGRDMSGAATVNASGVILGDGTRFQMDIAAQTTDLAIGITQFDPLLRGDGTLQASVARTSTDRFRVSDFDLRTDAATITANAAGGTTGDAVAMLNATVNDASILGQGLTGAITAALDATRDNDNQAQVTLRLDGPGTDVDVRANISPDYLIDGIVTADIASLAPYRTLIGQPVSGGVTGRLSGSMMADLSAFDANVDLQTSNLEVGNPIADILLAGNGRLAAQARLLNSELVVNDLVLSTANLTASGNLGGQSGTGRGTFTARLRDVGVLTDQLSGPINANGTASLDSVGNWGIDAQADGPGGIAVRAGGQVGANGTVNLTATGEAPLGLANTLIEPRRISGDAIFDIAINGRPSLNAVSGRLDLRDARLTAPTLAQGLSNIAGGVTLANGTAQIGITGDVISGGSVALLGPVSLSSPQTADLEINLNEVILKDPELYQTSISGGLTVKGPVTGGARIAGLLTLGQTDIQVPSSGVGAFGDLPNVTHIGASTAIKTTLDRAGLSVIGVDKTAKTSNAPPFPLDITINAPSRIFIRGRGLDAELGGTLRIGGTTTDIQPIGLFELTRGRIDILQQRFDLTEGSASLQGDFEPYIRLVATTEARTGTIISIIVEGPATEPEVSFVSTPSLPQDEVLSQLIFGRDLQNISPLQAVQLAAAVGTLAGRGDGGLINDFRKNIGLDDFDVTTDENGNAAVRAGKYLSENIYTDVTVSSDGSTEVNLNLDITDEITAKGTVDADGETSVGIFFERDY
ncbi:MAG: translocation and assembly module TamB [Yoonia sp.]